MHIKLTARNSVLNHQLLKVAENTLIDLEIVLFLD